MELNLAPVLYLAAARAMFAPFGGVAVLRREALDVLDIRRGMRVLELGCGPGEVTVALIERGAAVHGVDRSPTMLRAAARAAPRAVFEQADLRTYEPVGKYDVILLAFVLHELPLAQVAGVVGRAAAALAPAGRVAILDHATPDGAGGWIWRSLLRAVEPRAVGQWLSLDVPHLLRQSGLSVTGERRLAGGRVRLTVAR